VAGIEEDGVLLAVSLDITNAFNTLPWRWIIEAIEYHVMHPYLAAITGTISGTGSWNTPIAMGWYRREG